MIYDIKETSAKLGWFIDSWYIKQVWKKSSWCCSSYGSKSVYIQDGRHAAILNDINNLFDVHNPQTVPILGLKFQTSWPIHFWEIAVHGRTYVRTYGRRSNYKPPFWGLTNYKPPFWGLKIHKCIMLPNVPLWITGVVTVKCPAPRGGKMDW